MGLFSGLGGALGGFVNNVMSGGSFFSGSGFDFNGSITPGALADMLNGKTAIDYQNKLNVENWHMQNEYNKPINQMARFREAGLNPNLIYSQQNTAGPVGSVSAPNTPTMNDVASVVSKVFAMRQMAAQVANLKQQNTNLQSQDALLGQQADYTAEQTRRMQIDNDYLEEHGLSTFSPSFAREVQGVPDALINSSREFFDWFSRGRSGHKINTIYRKGDF